MNYLAMGGYPHFSIDGVSPNGQYAGIFTYQARKTIATIQDGSSNTIAYGILGSGPRPGPQAGRLVSL